jgi:predicted neuraminidase
MILRVQTSAGLAGLHLLALGALLLNGCSTVPKTPSAAGNFAGSEFIYTNAPFPECHASTIVESRGRVVAAWFGGTEEGNKDVGIWVSRLDKRGWSPPVEVVDGVEGDRRYPCWNPVLFQPAAGPLLLFYKVGPNPRAWWGMVMTSADSGLTWSTPRRLPEGILGPIKNKPVELAPGEIVSPSSSEHDGWRVHFEISTDNGASWTSTGPINDGKEFGAIQPAILVHADGRLQALGRSRQKTVFQTWSSDRGRTWGSMAGTLLPNPNSGIDAVTLRDGRHVIVYNHTESGRSPLNVAVSSDGVHWQPVAVLDSEPGEYSYPAVIQAADGRIHITYTWKRLRIKHVVLDPSALLLPGV